MSDPIVSHGRGGTGNIRPDPTPYTDGEIVREGPIGHSADGAFSTGRGGQGNIGSPGIKPIHQSSHEIIPEAALRPSMEERNYHIGRGGEGNAQHASDHHHHQEKHRSSSREGLADKLRNKLFKKKSSDNTTAETSTSDNTTAEAGTS